MVSLAVSYYEKFTGKRLGKGEQQIVRQMIEAGLKPADVFRAVDTAVSRWGMCGAARDYWETTVKECRRRWRELRTQGLLEESEKPPR